MYAPFNQAFFLALTQAFGRRGTNSIRPLGSAARIGDFQIG
jgi:hypothetical protein